MQSRFGGVPFAGANAVETLSKQVDAKIGDVRETWWSWYRWIPELYRSPRSIVFCEVATHSHFAMDRGGRVFKQTAHAIKLKPDADDDAYRTLLGVLSSAIACFWIKQVCHCKGGSTTSGGIKAEAWERFYAINGTKLLSFPLPVSRGSFSRFNIDELAQQLSSCAPGRVVATWHSLGQDAPNLRDQLEQAARRWESIRAQMISLQEELDWLSYYTYGLSTDDYIFASEPPPVALGHRAFEIVMARKIANGELDTPWFERHGSSLSTTLPSNWPDDYRRLVERRIEAIESDPDIGLLEQPEYKRRWNNQPWKSQLESGLQEWLIDRLENYSDLNVGMTDEGQPTSKINFGLVSVANLADVARSDELFQEVGSLFCDDPAFNVDQLVVDLVQAETVPLLPILRYKPTGLRKHAEWENTWELQRREDSGEEVGTIPVPPKYEAKDYIATGGARYFALRGKLDVPNERWISFPHCEGPDGTLMVAWAGYDHLQLAKAISAYYVRVQEELGGRDDPRLIPLLACLIELLPWLKQWHNEVDPEFRMAMGDYFEGFINEEARNLDKTIDEIKAWTPPQKARARRRSTV